MSTMDLVPPSTVDVVGVGVNSLRLLVIGSWLSVSVRHLLFWPGVLPPGGRGWGCHRPAMIRASVAPRRVSAGARLDEAREKPRSTHTPACHGLMPAPP